MYSSFVSQLSHGKKRVLCHEVHTVNINHINANWQQEKSRDPRDINPQQTSQVNSIPNLPQNLGDLLQLDAEKQALLKALLQQQQQQQQQ